MKKPMHQPTKAALFALGVLIALVAFWFMNLSPYGQKALVQYGDGAGMLDMRLFYSGAEAARSLESLGLEGSRVYLRLIAVDFIFIAGFALAMGALVGWLKDALRLPKVFLSVALIGYLRAAFDVVENVLISVALLGNDKQGLLSAAGFATLLKWICLALYAAGVVAMLAYRLFKNPGAGQKAAREPSEG